MPPPDGPALSIEDVASLAALEALRGEWHALWRAMPDATPFQSPDWLVPWWRHIGEGALCGFALRAGDALVGIVPLYIYAEPDGRRLLFPLGIATSDYLDALIVPEHRAAGMALVFERLESQRDVWDCCEWPQLRPGATLLDAATPAGWTATAEAAEPCPVLRRSGDFADTVPAETLASFGRRCQRAAKKGALRFETADADNAAALLDAHLRLHGARWTARGEAGVLAADAVQAVHRDALPGMLRDGTLLLHALWIGDRIAATLQGFQDPPDRDGRHAYFYLGGFDPAFERLSPGMLVVGHAIERALRDGVVAIDFLRGREPHKYAWGAIDTPTWRRHLRP